MDKKIEKFIQENVATKDYAEQLVDVFYGRTELFPSLLLMGMEEEDAAAYLNKAINDIGLSEMLHFHIKKMAYHKLVELKRFMPNIIYGFFPTQCEGDLGIMNEDTYVYIGGKWVNTTNSKQK